MSRPVSTIAGAALGLAALMVLAPEARSATQILSTVSWSDVSPGIRGATTDSRSLPAAGELKVMEHPAGSDLLNEIAFMRAHATPSGPEQLTASLGNAYRGTVAAETLFVADLDIGPQAQFAFHVNPGGIDLFDGANAGGMQGFVVIDIAFDGLQIWKTDILAQSSAGQGAPVFRMEDRGAGALVGAPQTLEIAEGQTGNPFYGRYDIPGRDYVIDLSGFFAPGHVGTLSYRMHVSAHTGGGPESWALVSIGDPFGDGPAPVPLPAPAALLGAAVLALCGLRRRRPAPR